MKHKRKLMIVLAILMIWMSVIACATMQTHSGWIGKSTPGKISYTYTKFTGIERGNIEAKAGQTLNLTYDVKIKRGRVFIQLMNPQNRVLWNVALKDDQSDSVEIPLELEGNYPLIIRGENTSGSFEVTWIVK